jgi:hypothetical protein
VPHADQVLRHVPMVGCRRPDAAGGGRCGAVGRAKRSADDENIRHASAGRQADRPGGPQGSRRAHTVVWQRLRGAAALAGHSWGPATAHRRPGACFTVTHRVSCWGYFASSVLTVRVAHSYWH